jgi:ligand-binding SRPBCC domain-containing protein
MAVSFTRTSLIRAPRERVFDAAASIDAHLASMARSRERAIGGVTSGLIGLGETVTWRAWHFGLPWTMTSRVTVWERPGRFADEQARGPFAWFRHEHTFDAVDGGTRMVDEVHFAAPLGPLGRLAELLVLRRYLTHLIDTRNTHLTRLAEAEAEAP